MTLTSIALLVFAVLAAVTSQLIFKYWVAGLGVLTTAPATAFSLVIKILQSPQMLLGLALYGAGFLAWMFLLSRNSLSFVYPLSLSLNVILVFLFARVFLYEPVSYFQMLGVALIIAGMYLVLAR